MIKSMKSMISTDFSYDVTVFSRFFPVFDATKKFPRAAPGGAPLGARGGRPAAAGGTHVARQQVGKFISDIDIQGVYENI